MSFRPALALTLIACLASACSSQDEFAVPEEDEVVPPPAPVLTSTPTPAAAEDGTYPDRGGEGDLAHLDCPGC